MSEARVLHVPGGCLRRGQDTQRGCWGGSRGAGIFSLTPHPQLPTWLPTGTSCPVNCYRVKKVLFTQGSPGSSLPHSANEAFSPHLYVTSVIIYSQTANGAHTVCCSRFGLWTLKVSEYNLLRPWTFMCGFGE